MLLKNRKCTEWPQSDIDGLKVNVTLYTLYTLRACPHMVQIVLRFALRSALLRYIVQGCGKSEMHFEDVEDLAAKGHTLAGYSVCMAIMLVQWISYIKNTLEPTKCGPYTQVVFICRFNNI